MSNYTKEKLDYLNETKGLIRKAIESKGQTVSDSDTFRSYADKILEISGGGSADLRYVTFMNDDGTVEYGKKAVATGDDCADPIARGIFSTPTKESSAQYNYTFAGWATTPNGGLNSNALKAVTEDRTVYANFASTVRFYTVTYYDSDGTTVLKTESLSYGTMPTPDTPEKSGFSFDGWEPAISTVTGNASYTAKWVEAVTFSGGSWEDIIRIAESGEAKKYFKVGDTKDFVFTAPDGSTINSQIKIVDFDKDVLADGTGNAAITVMLSGITYKQAHAASSGAAYDWTTSQVRTSLNGSVLNSFPEPLRNGIKSVTKCSRKYVDGTDLTGILETTEKVWAVSAGECGSKYDNSGYSYYPEKDSEGGLTYASTVSAATFAAGLRAAGVVGSSGDTNVSFRSAHTKYKVYHLIHYSNGSLTQYKSDLASNSAYILFGFCI